MQQVEIRECTTPEEFVACVDLQREVFRHPEVELSPARHLIVTMHAGGFTLGAFLDGELVGFVLSVPAFSGNERILYSHMTAISPKCQNRGIGAKLKWAQRTRALKEDVAFIKWTFQPELARNAYLNLEKLGAVVVEFAPNYYGFDYGVAGLDKAGVPSNRVFARWDLESEKVEKLSRQEQYETEEPHVLTIETMNDWSERLKMNPKAAINEQSRIQTEFESAFSKNLICRRFQRDEESPKYLFYIS